MIRRHRGLIGWFASNPVAADLLMLLAVIGGLSALQVVPLESFPSIHTGKVLVRVEYPGASPTDVEEGVVRKIEMALAGISGVKKITATAAEGLGEVTLTAKERVDVRRLFDQVRSRVEGIESFPDSVKTPRITEEVFVSEVLWLILSGSIDEKELAALGRMIRDELLATGQVSQIRIEGARKPEVRVEISAAALQAHGLSFDDAVQAVRASCVSMPAGSMTTANGKILIRTHDKPATSADLAAIVLRSDTHGTRLTLGDVAEITDGFSEAPGFLRARGRPALGLEVQRIDAENTLRVASTVHEFVRNRPMPAGVSLDIVADQSVVLKERINLLLKNLAQGGLCVFIILAMFLPLRTAAWTVVGIPVSYLGALCLMPLSPINASLNMLTLYGFILVVGILADDAIVTAESAERHRHADTTAGVIKGVRAVAMPITFGVLTTMAAFLPLLFLPGASGRLFSGIASVVMLCLFISLLESKLILPAHLARSSRAPDFMTAIRSRVTSREQAFVANVYVPALIRALRNKRVTVSLFASVLILCAGLLSSGLIRCVFFPDIPGEFIVAMAEFPASTPEDRLLDAARSLESAATEVNSRLQRDGDEKNDVIRQTIAYTSGDHVLFLIAELSPGQERMTDAATIAGLWKNSAPPLPQARSLRFESADVAIGEQVEIQLSSRNLNDMTAAAQELCAALERIPGVRDAWSTAAESRSELLFRLRPEAAHFGLTELDLARQIRHFFQGEEAVRLQRGEEDVVVRILAPRADRDSLEDLSRMHIPLPGGQTVPMTMIADTQPSPAPVVIERLYGSRTTHVRATVDKSVTTPEAVMEELIRDSLPALSAHRPDLRWQLSGEVEEENESVQALVRGSLLALFLIYALMAVPLKSYTQPLLIMAAIPFSVAGALLGHLLLDLPLSILSLCGIIALSGVCVNDAIVLVDRINTARTDGEPAEKAALLAGARRFRPVILTTATTFFGLTPMIFETSLQAQYLIPMAVSLAFGVVFATLVTLVFVPVVYLAACDARKRFFADHPAQTDFSPTRQ